MNKKFLDYFITKFGISVKTMQWFLDCSRKTVYNYRQMDYNELPEKVWHKIFNFFISYNDLKRIESFKEIYIIIDAMNKDEIIDCRERFISNALTRYAMKESDYISSFKGNSQGIKVTTNDSLAKQKKFIEIIEKENKKMYGNNNNHKSQTHTSADTSANCLNPNNRSNQANSKKYANQQDLNSNQSTSIDMRYTTPNHNNERFCKTIEIPNNVTEGFRIAFEEIINVILDKGNEYELLHYLSKYKREVE